MSSEDLQQDNPNDSVAANAPPAADGEAALAAAQAEIAGLRDQLLRAAAEAENVRRRATRDVENAHKFALDRFVADLLPVIDSVDQAVSAVGSLDQNDAQVVAVAEGVALSARLFGDTLARHGVETVEPRGSAFDPQRHEAMAMVPSADVPAGAILDVMQKGYVLNGRLVRAARVIVARAVPDTPPPSVDERA